MWKYWKFSQMDAERLSRMVIASKSQSILPIVVSQQITASLPLIARNYDAASLLWNITYKLVSKYIMISVSLSQSEYDKKGSSM